ncbi:lipoprotein LpqH [[Mycobacterium] burgundiense]|uniref:Lipoprotein LpqH n=1 Tax=[Mycobacterium] burgundiense TaxID=3064286 RepID=A0ABM9L8Y3_9MYCO|nr:lipoprotein LpqH [Mycolicibacterium sp. MU0053]CAJ1494891.1 lipoprotein LpqH [Mycolicibacterium sp. MU0053]
MKRALAVAVSGAAILIGGLVGCSNDGSGSDRVNEATESARSAINEATETAKSAVTSATDAAREAMDGPRVSIDGEDQNVEGNVTCAAMGGNIQIAIGDATTGVGAQVSEGDEPVVRSVGLGNVNGVALGYAEGAPGGEATAEKDGNTYTIKGTATGADMANPMEMVTKPFEIKVTCP